jgi:hypothetical protein
MSSFNTSTSHPLIPNANQYYFDRKYVSIHSEDRDILKYPRSTNFEIELPQDYLNVQTVTLSQWALPANYNVFSFANYNVGMTFKFLKLYNPGEFGVPDPLNEAIFAGLYAAQDTQHIIIIETGFYNPDQMVTELTNKFNDVITTYLQNFFATTPAYSYAIPLFTGYNRFAIVYNTVGQRIWFGNTADQFELTNNYDSQFITNVINAQCIRRNKLPSMVNWGLPSYLGFTRCPATAMSASQIIAEQGSVYNKLNGSGIDANIAGSVPRFFYGDVMPGDNGYWLVPVLPGASVYFLQAPAKINFMGPAYIYMEIDGLNNIDETSPYNISEFTTHTNETNGRVLSSFAKIPVPSTPISQWFDDDQKPYKYFNPPAERIRKLKVKLRYHDGQELDFGLFEYSFMLEFTLMRHQNERKITIVNSSF